MRNRIALAVALGVALLAITWWAWPARPPAPPLPPGARPNVVVLIGCTVRRDQTTPYGGPADTTPFLARLAAEGTRFDDAVATATWTREAVAGLLTGAPAATWGLPDPEPNAESPRVLVDEATTLAEHLRAAGYATYGVTANPNLNAEYGMAQGFDRYVGALPKGFAVRNRLDGVEVVARAMELLDGRGAEERARPFYLQVVIIDAHTPRRPTAAERAPFDDDDVPEAVRDYRATLARADRAFAALDAALAERGHGAHDTVFVFVADHGEGLEHPPHHRTGHGRQMYPSTAAIPWIVRGPGVPAGAVVGGLASGEDFAPTVLGLVGVPTDPAAPGRDWSRRVRAGGATDRARAFSLSMFQGADVASVWTPERQCQRDHGSRGIDPPMRTGCFDRRTDPWFAHPIDDVDGLFAELEAWRAARLAEGAARAVPSATPDDATREQLRELGYAE